MDYTNMSETDIAVSILNKNGKAMWYRDLVEEVMRVKGKQLVSHAISEIYTLINMDSRFAYDAEASKEDKKGMWGLAEWQKDGKTAPEEKA